MRRRNRRVRSLRSRLPAPRELAQAAGRLVRRGVRVYVALGIAGGVAGAGYLGYWWLTTSDRFSLATIEVEGNEHRDDAFVRELAGLSPGDNVFLVDATGVARALEADPWIAAARVERQLPDGLVVTVTEREPAALVELGGLYLVGDDGVAFKRADVAAGEGAGLPIITGIERDEYVSDQAMAVAAIRAALEAARRYSQADRPALSEVHVDGRGLSLRTYETGLSVRLGDATAAEIDRRLAAFDAAWASLAEEERMLARVIYLDNETNPDRVTVGF